MEQDILEITVNEETGGIRLDKFLADHIEDVSRSRIKALIIEGAVKGDRQGVLSDPSKKVQIGETITVVVPEPVDAEPKAENIPLDILFEDEHMLVINKAAGMVVHPGAGNFDGTLVNALLYHCRDSLSGIGGVARPGIVHRLDKDTSGLMVAAKTDRAHKFLSDQLADRTLGRHYSALVWRAPNVRRGNVNAPIGRHSTNRLKMAVNVRNSRSAKTFYTVERQFGEAMALMDCKLESGRTHQVRVHMAHINHPLIGDPLYGIQQNAGYSLLRKAGYDEDVQELVMGFPRQALHARKIQFIHPASHEEMTFETDLPKDFESIISVL